MCTESNSPNGILPAQDIEHLIASAQIHAEHGCESGQVQPASLDLRLGTIAYRLRASFLPGLGVKIADMLTSDLVMHKIDLSKGGAVLKTGCVYLVPLQESLSLQDDLSARANPKSSTGRLDVFTRVIADGSDQFEAINAGYKGPLYVKLRRVHSQFSTSG